MTATATPKTAAPTATIRKVRRNQVGTTSFRGLFRGMLRAQEFTVYPRRDVLADPVEWLWIQSPTRYGSVNIHTGCVLLCPPRPGGAYRINFVTALRDGKVERSRLAPHDLRALLEGIQ